MSIRAEIFGGPEERKARLLVGKKPKQADAIALTDVVIPREDTRRTDMRHEDRALVPSDVFKATFRGRVREVDVLNLSGGGAMIAAALNPNIFERIDLHLADGDTIECVVRWVKNGRLGVEFAHETKLQCSDDERDAVLREVLYKFRSSDDIQMVPVSSNPTESRTADRHPLIWFGELRSGSHRWVARLRNISTTGALVQCHAALRPGSEAVLDLGNGCALKASISWFVGDHAGVQFDEPFNLDQLSNCKPRVTPPTWVRPAYLEADVSADSAWDGPWNRMSVDDLRSNLEGFLKR